MKRDAKFDDINAYQYEYIIYCHSKDGTERVLFNTTHLLKVRKFLMLHRFDHLTIREIRTFKRVPLPPELSNL